MGVSLEGVRNLGIISWLNWSKQGKEGFREEESLGDREPFWRRRRM